MLWLWIPFIALLALVWIYIAAQLCGWGYMRGIEKFKKDKAESRGSASVK